MAKRSTSTKGGSTSNSTSNTKGSSATSSNSQSNTNSSSVSGSSSDTTSHSETNSSTQTEGGSHSYSYGKTWASGKVDDNTQQQYDKYNQDYTEGDKVTDAYNKLQNIIDNKPTFQSTYEDKLNTLYDKIMNRDKFSYDFNADNMYQMYKDNYTKQGEKAMQDTMGQASKLTGGYGSSYSQSAGQQAYQNYLTQSNDVIPELRNEAYQQYQDEGTELNNKYSITNDAYNREYGLYRDNVSDWQSDRSYEQDAYTNERDFDYNQYNNNRNYWNTERWNEKNAEQSNYQVTDSNYWENSQTHSETDAQSHTNSSGWENSNSATNARENSLTNTNSLTNASSNASNWSNSVTNSTGTGSSSSSKKSSNSSSNSLLSENNNNTKDTSFASYNIKNTDTLSKYDKQGIVDDLVDQLKEASGSKFDLAEIYHDLSNGFNYNGNTVTLTNAEVQYLKDKAFGK